VIDSAALFSAGSKERGKQRDIGSGAGWREERLDATARRTDWTPASE